MKTIKQILARDRNFTKASLVCTLSNIKSKRAKESTVIQERKGLEQVELILEGILENWDSNSKKLGLKVERFQVVDKNSNITIEKSLTKREARLYKKDESVNIIKL